MAPVSAIARRIVASAPAALAVSSPPTTPSTAAHHILSFPSLSSLSSSMPMPPSTSTQLVSLARLIARDDGKSTSELIKIIAPIVCVFIMMLLLVTIGESNRKKSGDFCESYGTAFFTVLFLTVLLPFTILFACVIAPMSKRWKARNKNKTNTGQPVQASAAAAGALNSPAGSGLPPTWNRPQMPLDPVIVMPDSADLDDPDAVREVDVPPPAYQPSDQAESTADATAGTLDGNGRDNVVNTKPL